jgi:hypothetical protein
MTEDEQEKKPLFFVFANVSLFSFFRSSAFLKWDLCLTCAVIRNESGGEQDKLPD